MENPLTWLSKRRFPYEPLITVEISKSCLIRNLNEFRKLAPGGNIAPVLKSNAYGHGLYEVASVLEKEQRKNKRRNGNNIPFFVVDSYFEAIALRSSGIKTPLLVIGYTRPEIISRSQLKNTAFTVSSLENLRSIKTGRNFARIHLKIDTGMNRQGILPEEINESINILKENSDLILEGICSHLCAADDEDESFTDGQINVWNRIVRSFKEPFSSMKYVHLSNTAGHKFGKNIRANVSRLGIGLYGLSDGKSFTPNLNLQPVLEIKTIVTGVKKIKPGETVGYDRTFKTEKDALIATIPIGYFEGVDRQLSNRGMVEIGPNRFPCPIIGRVSMNITTVDVSAIPETKAGTTAVVISRISTDQNSIQHIAEKCDTLTHEIAAKISSQLKRIVVD